MADITLVVDGNLFEKLVNFDVSPEGKESAQRKVNPVWQKMVKNANFLLFIREKNMKLALRIPRIQMKLGVQPEQTEMENMLGEVDIMDFAAIIVQSFDKNQ
jgi:hypothetical protein